MTGATRTVVAVAAGGAPLLELDYQPCPGDVAGTRLLARRCRERADLLQDARFRMRAWEPVRWQGEAADAAERHLLELSEGSRWLSRSLAAAADALDGWAGRLEALQAEATVLDLEAAQLRRELVAAQVEAVTGGMSSMLDTPRIARCERLAADLDRFRRQAGDLHQRYVVESEACSAVLDDAAPADVRGLTASWRGAWDQLHDANRYDARVSARVLDTAATGADHVLAAAGWAGLVPGLALPMAVVGLAAAGASVHARARLAVAAGGRPSDAAATVGEAFGAAVEVATARRRGPGAGPPQRTEQAERSRPSERSEHDWAMDGAASAPAEQLARMPGPAGDTWAQTVTTADGHELPITAHDVADPWDVGRGWLGDGYAGVATVTVTVRATPTASRTDARRSGQRDDDHRVGGGGR